MAKVKLSPLVNRIVGRLGNSVFRVWKGSTTVSSLPITVHNPSTSRQNEARNRLISLGVAFRGLSYAQKTAWEEYAQGLKSNEDPVGSGQLIKPMGNLMSGANAFVGVNARLLQSGLSMVTIPPSTAIPGIHEIDPTVTMGYNVPVRVRFDPDVPAGSIIRCFVRSNWAGGHTYSHDQYTVTGSETIVDGFRSTVFYVAEVRSGHGHNYYDLPVAFYVGKNIMIQCDIIAANGYKTPGSNVMNVRLDISIVESIETVYDLTEADYRGDLDLYNTAAGVPDMTGLSWFQQLLLIFCAHEGEDYTTITDIAALTAAGFPLSIAAAVTAGYLPEVSGWELLTNPFTP